MELVKIIGKASWLLSLTGTPVENAAAKTALYINFLVEIFSDKQKFEQFLKVSRAEICLN